MKKLLLTIILAVYVIFAYGQSTTEFTEIVRQFIPKSSEQGVSWGTYSDNKSMESQYDSYQYSNSDSYAFCMPYGCRLTINGYPMIINGMGKAEYWDITLYGPRAAPTLLIMDALGYPGDLNMTKALSKYFRSSLIQTGDGSKTYKMTSNYYSTFYLLIGESMGASSMAVTVRISTSLEEVGNDY